MSEIKDFYMLMIQIHSDLLTHRQIILLLFIALLYQVAVWYLRQHPKVQTLPFKPSVKRQDRVNARVRYIEGDITTAEMKIWLTNFETTPSPLTEEEKIQFLSTLDSVCISSDAFFPFRDSIDHASKVGVQYIAQAGGSVADDEVKEACREYGMTMAFTDLRLFLH